MDTTAEGKETAPVAIRPYRASDREGVRRVCADTGFLGSPIDQVFEDRELFADYLTSYYTDREPESTLVCEAGGTIVGYLTGCRNSRAKSRYHAIHNVQLFLRMLPRYPFYRPASRRYLHWLLWNGRRESPRSLPGIPHFHFNILAPWRSVTRTRELVDAFLGYLVQKGEKAVYGQIVVFDRRRGEKMFERYGFRVVDRVAVTKYADRFPGSVYLCTVVKDLEANPRLYGAHPPAHE
ncbi:GNAT family acetyltransferase [Methylacidimicrobium sp. B4]|uniref:GNAT family acetyltransferase n=1 Tax=Methylacidimicrobium sp. B4 TaxID=2796139 RepID=UPI001A8EA9E6|nr:GNAT family acetyltransferase [Methylacidimicrobium sp. B4]QSR83812.1 GNAT family acetyltransferase [Methylacidimicrobium sp. B4]